jgi:hypothetical protein
VISEKLIRFPDTRPVRTFEKQAESEELARQTLEFLRLGGVIKKCTSADNKQIKLNRTRREIIDEEKRRMIGRNNMK